MSDKLLEVKDLQKVFSVGPILKRKKIQAVRNVSFTVNKGETFALVGESGCGKSTTGKTAIKLLEPSKGSLTFNSKDINDISNKELRVMKRKMQMIFQDPYTSMNTRMTVNQILQEPFKIQNLYSKKEREERAVSLLEEVGMPSDYKNRYPHEFSGGQRQRIGIARALALNPELIVADEPVSALDVSVQAQVLNLMMDLQEKHNLSYLFISHDLSVVKFISHRIGVMYLGEIVELGDKDSIFDNPLHPYTQALLSSIPTVDRVKKERIILKGDVPSPDNPPNGCAFHTRCPSCMEICKSVAPTPKKVGDKTVSCHLYN